MEKSTVIDIDYAAVKEAAKTLRAVNHKLRQKIVKVIDDNKRINVTSIYVPMRLEQSVTSQHLAILRNANIVNTERDGKTIFYSLNNNGIEKVAKFVSDINLID